MARPTFVKKARKDNPVAKKGESYWWWSFRFGGKHYSKNRPRQSQLTQSEFLSGLYGAQEDLEDACAAFRDGDDIENFVSNIQDIASTMSDLASLSQDSLDNMPEGLQQGDTGMMLEDRVAYCEGAESDLESAASDAESAWAEEGEEINETDDYTVECPECCEELEIPHQNGGEKSTKCTSCSTEFKVNFDKLKEERKKKIEDREQTLSELRDTIACDVEGCCDFDCE